MLLTKLFTLVMLLIVWGRLLETVITLVCFGVKIDNGCCGGGGEWCTDRASGAEWSIDKASGAVEWSLDGGSGA